MKGDVGRRSLTDTPPPGACTGREEQGAGPLVSPNSPSPSSVQAGGVSALIPGEGFPQRAWAASSRPSWRRVWGTVTAQGRPRGGRAMPCGALHGTRDREGQAAPAAPRAGWASAATLSWPASRVVPRPSRGRARRDAAASNRETQGLTALSLPLFCKTATVLEEHSCGQLPSAKMHVRADGDPRPRGLPGSHPAPETLGQPPAPWGRPTLRREARSRGGRVARLPPPRTRMEPAPRARLRRPPHPA